MPSSPPRVAVIADDEMDSDAQREVVRDFSLYRVTQLSELESALAHVLQDNPELVFVAGGDRFIGRLATCYHRNFFGHATALRMACLPTGATHLLTDTLGIPRNFRHAVDEVMRRTRQGKLAYLDIPTLRVALSNEPQFALGFNFGAGLIYTWMESARRMRGGHWGQKILQAAETVGAADVNSRPMQNARVVIDAKPQAEARAFLMASTLQQGFFSLPMNCSSRTNESVLCARWGSSSGQLYKEALKARTPLSRLRRVRGAERVEQLTLDYVEGFVLDGELFAPHEPFVVHVGQGPKISVAVLH